MAPAAIALFMDLVNAMFQPFSVLPVCRLQPVEHFVFSVPKALAMLPAFPIVSALVSALFRRLLAKSGHSEPGTHAHGPMNAVLEPVIIGSGIPPDRNPAVSRNDVLQSGQDSQMSLWLAGEAGSEEARFENILNGRRPRPCGGM